MHEHMIDPSLQCATVRLVNKVFPNRSIEDFQLLSGGLINTNIKVLFGDQESFVLRLYRDGPAACLKELALHDLIKSAVPVAKIIHAEPDGFEDLPAFSALEFVDGLTFQQLKRTRDLQAVQQAAYSVGETLATIGRFRFPKPGALRVEDGTLTVGSPFIEGPNPIPRLLDKFLSSPVCQQRAGSKLIDQIHEFGWSNSDQIPDLHFHPSLVHCDFGNRNIVVHQKDGGWGVAAVLDWELAFSGSALLDVGNFLRYERFDNPLREPYFSRGFTENGGELLDNWKLIVRIIDLTGLVECLTHKNLPDDVTSEIINLIEATIAQINETPHR
jgi:aminoglycoside phosphotransferase (APT) family kinase protein